MTVYAEKCSQSMTGHPEGILDLLTLAFCQWMSNQRLRFSLAKERRQLLDMPEHMLKDMGVSRYDAITEALREDIPSNREL